HRDIKPDNILISEGHALVAVFVIARATNDDGATLTEPGLAIGTPQYMSPEQASGDPNIDGRTDIYALGCVLYEMIAGEPPFTGPTAQAVISRSITEDPRPLTRTRPSLPPQIDAVTMKALAKSPADRYQTASDFAAALAGAAAATTTVIDASPRPFLKPWMSIAAALLIVALGAASIKLFGGPGAASARQVRSVAVLPFANQGAAEDAYFADGIVDEVRTRLARLDKFTVIASASADEYRDS